jgi:hypothetical protein
MFIDPPVPAATIAALAVITPSVAFRVEASSIDCPVGKAERKPSGVGRQIFPIKGKQVFGITVIFNEYALAVAGIEHTLDCIGNVRVTGPISDGGPNGPENPLFSRVSATRQGVIAKKVRAVGVI